MRKRIIGAFIVFMTLALWYQNCGSQASWSEGPLLSAGAIDPSGDPVDPNSTSTPSPTPMASSTPNGTPIAAPTPDPSTEKLCILNANSKTFNIAFDSAVLCLDSHQVNKVSACMSANACLNLVNNYLNLTGGVFGGTVGAPPLTSQQYTEQKMNSVCQSNPNVIHLSDADVGTAILSLEGK